MPSPKSPITYVRRPTTRSTTSKGKAILQDTQQNLQEEKNSLIGYSAESTGGIEIGNKGRGATRN